MKILFSILLTISQCLTLYTQNPIIKEEHYREIDGEWQKQTIIERTYDNQGILETTQETYFERAIQQWALKQKRWFDKEGNEFRELRKFFIYRDSTFGVREIRRTFDDQNRILQEDTYKSNEEDAKLVLDLRTEYTYLEDCSVVSLYLKPDEANNGVLTFSAISFQLSDENCQYLFHVTEYEEVSIENLRNKIRVQLASLENGKQSRIIKTLVCAEETNCEDWRYEEQKIFDAEGRLIYFEDGSKEDFSRRLTTYEYQGNQKKRTYRYFSQTTYPEPQTLILTFVEVTDLNGKGIYSQLFEPYKLTESTYAYNSRGQFTREFIEITEKKPTGTMTTRDTNFIDYEYYCDSLVKTKITDYGQPRTRFEYSYLEPANCEILSAQLASFNLFPNPANQVLNVVSDQFLRSTFSISIIDVYGKVIYQQQNDRNPNQLVSINSIPNGVYFLQLNSQDKVLSKSFIIAR